jgi:hypothetical protein
MGANKQTREVEVFGNPNVDVLSASPFAEGSSESRVPITRRVLVGTAVVAGLSVVAQRLVGEPPEQASTTQDYEAGANHRTQGDEGMNGESTVAGEIAKPKIRRALPAGPHRIAREVAVTEMDDQGKMTVLRPGTNDWVSMRTNENLIGQADMCIDRMGLQWMMDCFAKMPKPTITSPRLIYMLNGALQRSYTDSFDRASPAIPIGPHWMILWPFDPETAGLPTTMRDAGTLIMFAGTPYAHLHICGSPWDGNEYLPSDRGVWTMTYSRP